MKYIETRFLQDGSGEAPEEYNAGFCHAAGRSHFRSVRRKMLLKLLVPIAQMLYNVKTVQ